MGKEMNSPEKLILIIDDDEFIMNITKEILEVSGYSVLTAADGQKGLELYHQNRGMIDLVILDMIMPEMNGEQCFLELKRNDPEVKVLIYSSYVSELKIRGLLKEGVKDFIPKPFRNENLLSRIRTILETN